MKKTTSLGRYLATNIGIVAIPPIIILAGLIWLFVIPQLQSDLGLQQGSLARVIANQVSAYLVHGERHLEGMAAFLEDCDCLPRKALQGFLDANTGKGDTFETIYIANKNDYSISHIGLPENRRHRRLDLVGLDLSGRAFTARVRDAKKPFWSHTFLSTASGSMAIALIVPMANDILVGEIALDRISHFVSRLPLGTGLLIMVTDQRGRIVADSEKRREGQQLDLSGLPPGVGDRGGKYLANRFELFDTQFTGTVVNVRQLGWKILVAQPNDLAFKSLRTMLFIVGLAMALLLGLILAGSWFQARRMSRLTDLFVGRLESITLGDYDITWPRFKTTEYTELSKKIRRMAESISRREKQMQASESGMRITLDSIGDAVIATDEKGLVTRMNPAAEKMTGWPFAEARGLPLPEVFNISNAQTGEKAKNPVDKVLATGKVVGLANHTMLKSRDGARYQIADSGAPIRREDGVVVGVVLVFRDVTEDYSKDQKLRENEKLLKSITANVPGVTFQMKVSPDNAFTLSYVSPKHAEFFGFDAPLEDTPAVFIGHLPLEDRKGFVSTMRAAVTQRSDWIYEGRYLHPSGKTIWFAGKASPQEIDGECVYHGLWVDTTEKHRMTDDLHLAKTIFDKASLAIYRIGAGARILEVNDQAVQQTGYSKRELSQMTAYDLDPGITKETAVELWRQIVEQGTIVFETTHRRKDGSEFPAIVTSQLLSYGQEMFSASFVQDITKLKEAEEEAKQLESALAQSQKMEAIGTLAGGIAHDFNNMLSAVIGFAELALTAQDPDSTVYGYVDKIHQAGIRAGKLVSQILTFSRRDETKLSPLQAAPLVKEALKLLRSSLPATIEMSEHIEPGLDNVMADPTQIHQIVMNLCTNAFHAMEDGGGTLLVSLSQVELSRDDTRLHPGLDPGGYLRLSVQDTGCGMPPEVVGKIFEPYFTTKDKGKGTGLGLAVVHGLVSGYGGAIYAYSEPGVGSTFNVYLPAIKDEAAAPAAESTELSTGSGHILVVDDEPDLVEVHSLMLEQMGYTVTTASSAIEALEMFSGSPSEFDLILTDMTMPKMTGDKLAREVLKIRPDMPVVISTGYSVNLSEDRIAGSGIRAVVQKPVVQTQLADILREILGGD